jgi:hypothetical protein
MRKFGVLLFCFIFLMGMKSFAQITITESDAQAFFSLGNELTVSLDSTTTMLGIGSTGETSWDFSALSIDVQTTVTSVDPSGTPYADHFPSATACISGTTFVMGAFLASWQYGGIDNAVLTYGTAAEGMVGGFPITDITSYNPPNTELALPLDMGSSWSEDYVETDTLTLGGFPVVTVTNIHEDNIVDAYGTMKLPGGDIVPALRLKTDERENTQVSDRLTYSRSITYLFITNSGTQISVEAADTVSADTGSIAISPPITYIKSSVTAVRQVDNNLPDNFNLEQNYPNPFNPTTQINYSIPSSRKVVLKVYDELGREVAELVNSDQSAGNYSVDFNASGLASGVYFYRLQAGSFVQMKKMILMK